MKNEIGILLGQYSGSQSFENISSWDNQVTQSSLTLQTTNTHSSNLGACLQVSSGGSGSLSYDYGQGNDLYDRWHSDTTTHRLVSYFWARVDTAGNSGQVTAVFSNQSIPIAFTNSLTRYRIETNITSETSTALDFQVSAGITSTLNLYIDDIVTAVDVIDFTPDWGLETLTSQNVVEHTTIQGRQSVFSWGESGEWNVPLSHVNDLRTALINNWWRKSRNLYVTFNTSDTTNFWITRISNQSNPFTGIARPYNNYGEAILNLQTVHYSLDY